MNERQICLKAIHALNQIKQDMIKSGHKPSLYHLMIEKEAEERLNAPGLGAITSPSELPIPRQTVQGPIYFEAPSLGFVLDPIGDMVQQQPKDIRSMVWPHRVHKFCNRHRLKSWRIIKGSEQGSIKNLALSHLVLFQKVSYIIPSVEANLWRVPHDILRHHIVEECGNLFGCTLRYQRGRRLHGLNYTGGIRNHAFSNALTRRCVPIILHHSGLDN